MQQCCWLMNPNSNWIFWNLEVGGEVVLRPHKREPGAFIYKLSTGGTRSSTGRIVTSLLIVARRDHKKGNTEKSINNGKHNTSTGSSF
jgi:hypothetical protein